jgi:hypothetical protein
VRKLLGLPLSDSILQTWSENMVFALEPLFLPFELAQQFDVSLTRAEFGQWLRLQPLEYADAYQPWAAASEWVVLAERVPVSLLPDINAAVVQSKRGLVFPLELARSFAVPEIFLERDSSDDRYILRLEAWKSLTQEQRFAWLCQYVSQDAVPCRSSQYPQWAGLVGWQAKSGANCFSMALLGHDPTLQGIPDWLQPQTLMRLLEQRGYIENESDFPLEPHDVLVWKNREQVVHASAYLGDGLVLNKDSQAWYSPRQVLRLETLLERWNEPDLAQMVFTRGGNW